MKGFRGKLRSRGGIALVFVILIGAIAAVVASILFLGYQQHLKDARMLADELTVTTAQRLARETYILDLRSGGVTYYYDDIHKTLTDTKKVKGKVPIKGYGMCYASENTHGETGAIGIPNKGRDGGSQFLAVSIEADGSVHSRWQGPWLTGEDYELMTPAERKRLTTEQLNQIDSTLIYERGQASRMTEGETDAGAETESETEA